MNFVEFLISRSALQSNWDQSCHFVRINFNHQQEKRLTLADFVEYKESVIWRGNYLEKGFVISLCIVHLQCTIIMIHKCRWYAHNCWWCAHNSGLSLALATVTLALCTLRMGMVIRDFWSRTTQVFQQFRICIGICWQIYMIFVGRHQFQFKFVLHCHCIASWVG